MQLNSLNDFMEEFRFSQPTQKVLRQFMHYQHSNEEVGRAVYSSTSQLNLSRF